MSKIERKQLFSLSIKWLPITKLGFLFLLFAISGNSFAQTRAEAQHRLPPVIYSLDIPENKIVSGWNTTISWSLVGYHDTYEVDLVLYDETGQKLHDSRHMPYRQNTGGYFWGEIRPQEFHYQATVNVHFVENQDITVRFFGVPLNDPIENETFLSVIVPGGHQYRYLDSGGRQILVNGIADEFWKIADEFLSITDAVCGEDIAHFTAHYRDPIGRETWRVTFTLPPNVSIDFIAPTPNSQFDETLGHLSQLFGSIPGVGTLWSAVVFGADFFDNDYLDKSSFSHTTGRIPTDFIQRVPSIPSNVATFLSNLFRVPERKLNIRLRGTPPSKDWYLMVTRTELKLRGGRTWGPTRIPLRCFGGPSDN